jgi:hypothetical protein
LEAEAI